MEHGIHVDYTRQGLGMAATRRSNFTLGNAWHERVHLQHAASMHDLLKARPRSVTNMIVSLHDESSTSTARYKIDYSVKCTGKDVE